MLEISTIRNQTELVKAGLRKKNFKELELVDAILKVDEQRKKTQLTLDEIRNKENLLAKEIGELFKQGKKEEAGQRKASVAEFKEDSSRLTEELNQLEEKQKNLLVILPNLPTAIVPEGKTPEENSIVKQVGEIPVLPETAQPH